LVEHADARYLMQVFLEGVGLRGPGLSGWTASRPILAGREPYVPADVILPPLDLLPPAERRRTGLPAKLALQTGLEALAGSLHPPDTLASVFASSGADGQVIHQICESLAREERDVSPTRFHNSVHNAPAGYWSIALRSRAPSTSLSCFDCSFVAGLLEACAYCSAEAEPALLLSYDAPYPEPLNAVRQITASIGVALLLSPQATSASLARLDVQIEPNACAPTLMRDPALEALRGGNPTARALPLLAALTDPSAARLVLEYLRGTTVTVAVSRC
jgi:hypothetical protein